MLNFVYCFDENYNSQALTSINSLLQQTSKPVNIYIIHENPKTFNLDKIDLRKANELKIFDIQIEDIEFPNISGSHVSRATYFRFYLSRFLPNNLDYIIYIDSDILCLNDPAIEIEKIIHDLKGTKFKLAARTEATKKEKDLKVNPFENLKMKSENYFNAGLMIIDYQYWLNSNIENELFEIMFAFYDDIIFWDQDVLNKYFDGQYFELNPIFNYEVSQTSNVGDTNYDEDYILNNVILLHFSGKGKPWNANYVFYDSSKLFQTYYRKLGIKRYLLTHASGIKGSSREYFKNIFSFRFLKLDYPFSYLYLSFISLFKFKLRLPKKERIIYEEQNVKRNKPKNLEINDMYMFSHEIEKKIPKSFVKLLRNPIIINNSIFDYKNFRLYTKETFYENHTYSKKIKDTIKNLLRSDSEIERIKNGVWIFDTKSENFGHWMIDSLCRYLLVPKDFSSFKLLVPQNFNISWLIEMLDFLKLPYVLLDENKRYKVDKLILTSRAHPSGNYNVTIVNELRDKFLFEMNDKKIKRTRRIWTYREHLRRKALNFEEIVPILKKYNFEIVKMEDLSLIEKIQLLFETEIISGTHGSGLINLFFMQKGSKIFEVRDYKDNLKNSVFSLASAFDIDYYYMEREKPLSIDRNVPTLSQIDGGSIDPVKFEEKLLMCING